MKKRGTHGCLASPHPHNGTECVLTVQWTVGGKSNWKLGAISSCTGSGSCFCALLIGKSLSGGRESIVSLKKTLYNVKKN